MKLQDSEDGRTLREHSATVECSWHRAPNKEGQLLRSAGAAFPLVDFGLQNESVAFSLYGDGWRIVKE
jgi:hypothetical protein